MKEFSGDVRRILEIRELAPDLAVIAGADDLTLEALLMGATGWFAGFPNVFPKESVRLFDLAVQGKLDEARALYEPLVAAFRWDSRTEFVQAIKYGMDYVGRYGGPCRPPRGPLVPEHVAQLEQDMKKAVESLAMRSVRTITAIDSHTEGMPTRVVTGGVGVVPGATMAERREYFVKHLDDLRLFLMNEPRGHAAMSGAILQPPTRSDADWGVLYIEVSGCLPMCGHGTIGVATVLVESGMVEVTEPITKVRLDTPAGLVVVDVAVSNGRRGARDACATSRRTATPWMRPWTCRGWGR